MANYREYPNRLEWLASRTQTLGASEVASAIGIGFTSQLDLWKEKTNRRKREDLSDNKRVDYGTRAEEHIRELFAIQNQDRYSVEYHPYRVYFDNANPFLTATLDGELVRESDGKRGVWECKTAWISSKADLDKWSNNSIPQHYYCQVCEQLAVTGFDFVVLSAQLIFLDGNSEIRHYVIERNEVEPDIEYIKKEAIKFWSCVQKDTPPNTRLTL